MGGGWHLSDHSSVGVHSRELAIDGYSSGPAPWCRLALTIRAAVEGLVGGVVGEPGWLRAGSSAVGAREDWLAGCCAGCVGRRAARVGSGQRAWGVRVDDNCDRSEFLSTHKGVGGGVDSEFVVWFVVLAALGDRVQGLA